MLKLLALAALAGFASSATVNINVPTNQPHQFITPRDSNTVWRLNTERGAKILVACAVKIQDCSRVQMVMNNGRRSTLVCGHEDSIAFLSSVSNTMTVTYKSTVGAQGGYCQVQATLPYLHLEAPQVDSSEHGTVPGLRSPSCKCGWTNKESSRIVGGEQTLPNEFPFPVLILTGDRRSRFCGASIITPYHVLTAAHCTYPKRGQKLAVMVGLHDLSKYNPHSKIIDVDRWFDHPDYNEDNHLHDISIMVLQEKIEYNDYIGPVCLPNKQIPLTNEVVKVMGWGLTADKSVGGTSSQHLRKVNLRVINLDVCKAIYSLKHANPTQICTHTNDKDSCQGDSGGPLVWLDPKTNRYVQVALVSYGRECASTDPGVNTDVWAYMPWINKIIRQTNPQPTCS